LQFLLFFLFGCIAWSLCSLIRNDFVSNDLIYIVSSPDVARSLPCNILGGPFFGERGWMTSQRISNSNRRKPTLPSGQIRALVRPRSPNSRSFLPQFTIWTIPRDLPSKQRLTRPRLQ